MISAKEKINLKIIIFSAIGLWCLIFLSIVYCNFYINKEVKNYFLKSIEDISEQTSDNINKAISTQFNILKVISMHLTDEEVANPHTKVEDFNEIMEKNDYTAMAIVLPDGTAYLHNGEVLDLASREYFQKSMQGENWVSNQIESKIDLTIENVYSVPIIKNNQVVAVLCASVTADNFYKDLNLSTINQFDDSFVISESGDFVAGKNIPSNVFNLFDYMDKHEKVNEDSLRLMKDDMYLSRNNYGLFKFNNKDIYMYYTKLNYNNWWVVSMITRENFSELSKPIINIISGISIALILLLSISFTVIFFRTRKTHEHLKIIAYTDTITEGKNDIFLKANIKKIINEENKFAFISLEISNIKTIINMLGLKNTHFLLKDIYNSISEMLNEGEYVSHSYLGEYKVILIYDNFGEFRKRIESINQSNKTLDFRMGIYLIDNLDSNFEDMCSYVNIAKESLTDNHKYAFYTKELHNKEIDKIKLEEDIEHGISNKEFKVWFQPKYGKDGISIIGAEALVRWYKYGAIISPYVFIPICEVNGLIKEIDELVIEDVCRNLRIWLDENKQVVPISINLSRNYLDKIDFIDRLENIINTYDIPKELIEFEVTESSLVSDGEKLKENIDILKSRGYKILLDDFGVGYSSIKTISDIKFDTLKIDKSFIDGIGQERWENIIDYTIYLSKCLNMNIIAEGIETEEQYQFLLNCNCDVFQGYYFNKPMNSNEFSKLLAT